MAKYKAKIFFTLSLTAFAVASLVLTIFNNNPFSAATSVFIIFYSSLFISIFGISIFLIILFKKRISDQMAVDNFWPSARISLLIATAVTILLALRGMRVLDLWVGVPLTLAILMMELFFRGNKYKRQNEG